MDCSMGSNHVADSGNTLAQFGASSSMSALPTVQRGVVKPAVFAVELVSAQQVRLGMLGVIKLSVGAETRQGASPCERRLVGCTALLIVACDAVFHLCMAQMWQGVLLQGAST